MAQIKEQNKTPEKELNEMEMPTYQVRVQNTGNSQAQKTY